MALWKNGSFIEDQWRHVEEGEAVPPSGHVILPLDWWMSERAIFLKTNVPVGIRLDPGSNLAELPDDLVRDLERLSLIALPFASFADGRAFSTAAILRERHGFDGELRAIGDVLIDQIRFMERCGFTSFEITNAATEQALRENRIPLQQLFYQPASIGEPPAGTRPWLRRAKNG